MPPVATRSTVILLVVAMSLLLSRFSSRVRAWTPPHPRRYFGSSLALSRWQVGDHVSVPAGEGGEWLRATVDEARGGGWYQVMLLDSNNATLKVRGTQLRQFMTEGSSTYDGARREPVQVVPSIARRSDGPVPPPPMIVDLDAALQQLPIDAVQDVRDKVFLDQVAHHLSFTKWVVFTDLHCAPSTLETSLQVLDCVQQLALERNAGVLFLGDFWHHRGTLRVDCLNAVLDHLSSWTVPMVLIPGNHDQVTLGGHDHSLTPLENAYRVERMNADGSIDSFPGPLVLSHPTKFGGALFVPHIRDHATMESVLQSKQADEATAIFVHADVAGAYMNDLIQSLGGVPPSMFPADKPIYSGHFHKPHVVESSGRVIEYLGSPYETSLSEAQQPKALVVVDSTKDWATVERIPLDIGRKHFRATTVEDFIKLEPADNVERGPQVGQPPTSVVRAGDRVVLSIDKGTLESLRRSDRTENPVDLHVRRLRKAGAVVEVREISTGPVESMGAGLGDTTSELEDLSPASAWKAYLAEEVRREAMSNETGEELSVAGLELLEEVEAENDDFRPQVGQRNTTDLQLVSLSLEGFGPFHDAVHYPLLDRGLVLLRGTNKNGGADSNGSGKSSLAMSMLWCLTGSLDPRPFQDSKVSDVVNDDSKSAKVTLKGVLNGVDFTITRTKTATKSGLVFLFGEKDLTAQSAKETQVLLEEKLGVGPQVLSRTMFHGQHALNELLEATDAKLKDELALVVPLAIWREAVTLARNRAREATKRSDELSGMLSVRSEDLERHRLRLEEARDNLESRRREYNEARDVDAGTSGEGALSNAADLGALEAAMTSAAARATELEAKLRNLQEQRDVDVQALEGKLRAEIDKMAATDEHYQILWRQKEAALVRKESIEDRVVGIERAWGLDLSSGVPGSIDLPSACPTCKQPLAESPLDHSHSELVATIERDVATAVHAREEVIMSLGRIDEALATAEADRAAATTTLTVLRDQLAETMSRLTSDMNSVELQLAQAREDHGLSAGKFSRVVRGLQQAMERDASTMVLEKAHEAFLAATATYEALEKDMDEFEALVEKLQMEKDEQERMAETMTALSSAFGQRGVQTFVLQNAVDLLQSSAQYYLDDFSDGAQRLQLALDAGDRISRMALVREADGDFRERSLASLSGGQWRRCSLALTLGFADMVSRRGKLRPSLCVLDEPLTHLDRTGRAGVGRVLRRMLSKTSSERTEGGSSFTVSTIIMILQDLAAEELEEAFDCIDEVVKSGGSSFVLVDERV